MGIDLIYRWPIFKDKKGQKTGMLTKVRIALGFCVCLFFLKKKRGGGRVAKLLYSSQISAAWKFKNSIGICM